MSSTFRVLLGDNDGETRIKPVYLNAVIDERGVVITVEDADLALGVVSVEVFGGQLRCYLNDEDTVQGDPATFELAW